LKLSCFRTNMMMPTIAAAQPATATETSTQCEGAAAANKTSANSNESWNTPWTAVQLQATDEWLQQRLARKRASKGALVSGGGGGGGGGGGKQQRVERVAERNLFCRLCHGEETIAVTLDDKARTVRQYIKHYALPCRRCGAQFKTFS